MSPRGSAPWRMLALAAGVLAARGTAAAAAGPAGYCEVAPPIGIDGTPPLRVSGAPFSFAVTWDASVPTAWRPVIQEAITEWQNVLTDNGCSTNPLPIYVRQQALTGNLLALTQPVTWNATGCMAADTISFDPSYTWFVDPTPANDSEFHDPVLPPPGGYDLLTVARHELGHAVGWSLTTKNQGLVVNNVFDPVRLEVLTTTGAGGVGWHLDPAWLPDDLMVPSTGESERRAIALYPDVVTPARGFDGGLPIGCVDPTFGGVETGMPSAPWRTIATAQTSTPGAWPMLLANTTHHVTTSFTLNAIRQVWAVRGGATIVAP